MKKLVCLLILATNALYAKSLKEQLFYAAFKGNDTKVKSLIKKVNVKSTGQFGKTALGQALMGEHLHTIKLLVRNGANVNFVNSQGQSMFNIAVSTTPEIVNYLLKHGAKSDIPKLDSDGNTPLMNAALLGKSSIVKLLLTYDAHPRATNPEGENALSMAITGMNPNLETVKMLLKAGATFPKGIEKIKQTITTKIKDIRQGLPGIQKEEKHPQFPDDVAIDKSEIISNRATIKQLQEILDYLKSK